jgi:LPS-assembly protein
LPDDPGQEILPMAEPEPAPATGVPVEWEAQSQSRVGDTWTLTGAVVVHYRDYTLRADKVVYHQSTTELEAEGGLELAGGPNDVVLHATSGDMRLNMHTARFYNVHGSQGVRTLGRAEVYSSTNPLRFSGRVLLETGEGKYRIIDGAMTNCRLPRPDWLLLSRSIRMENGTATTANVYFKLFGVPIFYLPYLRHPVEEDGRQSGFLIPIISTGSSIRGYTFGEQAYWVISRGMDLTVGTEYYTKRGWAPSGDFRYRGSGLDHLIVRWNVLLDRGIDETVTTAPTPPATASTTTTTRVNQGGVDINALGRMDLNAETRLAGSVDYLSSYVYRLVFNDNYSQAVSSEVQSGVSLTHAHRGLGSLRLHGPLSRPLPVPPMATRTKILHTCPTCASTCWTGRWACLVDSTWGLGSSLGYLSRSEPGYHSGHWLPCPQRRPCRLLPASLLCRSTGRRLERDCLWPPLRETAYTISQTPDLSGINGGTPTISHDPLNRTVILKPPCNVRPPALDAGVRVSPA